MAIPGGTFNQGRLIPLDKRIGTHEPLDVKAFHRNDDSDSSHIAHHHTLGSGPTQAAAGNHEHRLQDIFLFRDTALTHDTNGNWRVVGWDQYSRWDQELFSKGTGQHTINILQTAFYDIDINNTFALNNAGRRGVRMLRNGVVIGAPKLNINNIATEEQLLDRTYLHFLLFAGDSVVVEAYQNSGGNLDILAGSQKSHIIIRKAYPELIDIAKIVSDTGIMPQRSGPDIASGKLLITNGAW